MNNDLLVSLSVKISRLNDLLSIKKKNENTFEEININIQEIKEQIEKTNEILLKIYERL